MMDSKHNRYETITFCSISKGNDIIFSCCANGDTEAKNLASIWLDKAPELHIMYSHSAENKTIAILKEGDHTFFAINEPSTGNLNTFMFLKSFRNEFKKVANRNDFQTELESVIHHLTTPICLPPPPPMQIHRTSNASSDRSVRMISGSTHDRKKIKDRLSNVGAAGESNLDSGLKIDMALESYNGAGANALRRSLSSKARQQQYLRKLWWHHVQIVVAIDAVLCLVLFGTWLMICRGFNCLS